VELPSVSSRLSSLLCTSGERRRAGPAPRESSAPGRKRYAVWPRRSLPSADAVGELDAPGAAWCRIAERIADAEHVEARIRGRGELHDVVQVFLVGQILAVDGEFEIARTVAPGRARIEQRDRRLAGDRVVGRVVEVHLALVAELGGDGEVAAAHRVGVARVDVALELGRIVQRVARGVDATWRRDRRVRAVDRIERGVGRTAGAVDREELVVGRVEPGDRRADAQAFDRPRVDIEFEALHGGIRRVGRHRQAVQERRDLQVRVVIVKGRGIHAQAIVEPFRLRAEFEALDELRVERQVRGRHLQVVEATGLEALRERRVVQRIFVRLPLDRKLGCECVGIQSLVLDVRCGRSRDRPRREHAEQFRVGVQQREAREVGLLSSLYRTPAVAVQVSVSLKSTCANAA
jgi:hypothetical protein